MHSSNILKKVIAIAGTCLLSQASAWAGQPLVDSFSGSNPKSSMSGSAEDQAKDWFKQYDQLISQYEISTEDQVILSQPIKSDAQRLQKFTQTASKIASNRHHLAKKIRLLPTPSVVSELKSYKDLNADWYDDSAEVYEDLIKPRKAASTIEELQDQINQVLKTSNTLKNNKDELITMDKTIRLKYSVDAANDALTKYINSPLK